MTYIDRTYMDLQMGPSVVSGCLTYGGTTTAQTGSVMDLAISSSQDFVDSLYKAANYSVPLADPDNFTKQLVGYKTQEALYIRSSLPVPENLTRQIVTDVNYLNAILSGKAIPVNETPSPDTAVQGGHSFSDSSDGGAYEPLVSIPKLRGSWF